jgi:NADH:ubiquinone reductase (non-electrogenic)
MLRNSLLSSSVLDGAGSTLSSAAEVACQKTTYLAQALNSGFDNPFEYRQAAMVAYLGQHDGVIAGRRTYSGPQAWIAWSSKNFLWTRTWRQKVLIVVSWTLDLLSGRNSVPKKKVIKKIQMRCAA